MKTIKKMIAAEPQKDFWVTNQTFSKLSKEAKEIRITKSGYLELAFQDDILGVKLDSKLSGQDGIMAYVMIVYVNDIMLSNEGKGCIIL